MDELVLVTGGSGYIGGWCVAELLRRGYQVRTTVRSPGREQAVTEAVSAVADPAGRLSFAVADLTSDDGWDAAVKGADYVLHVASPLGISPRGAATPDAMVAAARDETLWTDPDDPALIPYRRSKTLAERAAWNFMDSDPGRTRSGTARTELVTVLPGAVFGPILTTSNKGLHPRHPGLRGQARGPVPGPVPARDHPRPRPPQPPYHREGPPRPRLAAPPRP